MRTRWLIALVLALLVTMGWPLELAPVSKC
jgi:hypothetical protein